LTFPRILPVGDRAVTVELGDTIDLALNARVHALDASLERIPLPGIVETVPTYRALLVLYEPKVIPFAVLAARLLERAATAGESPPAGRLLEVPTCYGGEAGPDLPEVARASGLSEAEVVSLHTSTEYTAFMLGFRPGFAYLGLLPEALARPRRATPRVRVAAGSVAIAGRQTGIYPSTSPGGWHLIGRTSLRLFDPTADSPARIAAGDRVRFVSVESVAASSEPEAVAGPWSAATPVIEVVEPGLLTTVQDGGRSGHRRWGVPSAGALDPEMLVEANRAVGNDDGAAALECTLVGPALRFLSAVRIAVSGADLGAVLHRSDMGDWPVPLGAPVLARPGNVLAFTGRRSGARAYVAFAGGIDVPVVLGARATDRGAGFGGVAGRALQAGDRLCLGAARVERPGPGAVWSPPSARVTVRVVLGPQQDHFEPESIRGFLDEPWRVGSTSDRVGYRLEGRPLVHKGPSEIVTDGLVPGAIQVPPDGAPIVVLADGPTTGGYPKIAVVVAADLGRLAQLVPGEGEMRFTAVSVEDAQYGEGHECVDPSSSG
jgi:KipI family sensor histidine kinase inhibitor